MTKTRVVASVTAVGVLLAGAALYAQPYLVVHQMYSAVESRDSAAIVSFVDFPALRESIKAWGRFGHFDGRFERGRRFARRSRSHVRFCRRLSGGGRRHGHS